LGALAFSTQASAGGKFFPGLNFDEVTYAKATTFAGEPVAGMSSIDRTDDEFGISFNTRDLQPNHAYTIWVAAFNNPRNCLEPCDCGSEDVPVPEVDTGMFLAEGSGRVADEYGQANVDAIGPYGVLPEGEDTSLIATPAEKRAQMFLILRDHGPASEDPEVLEDQLSSHGGNCDEYDCQDVVLTNHASPFCRAPFHHHRRSN
jgi:hypothetical protein